MYLEQLVPLQYTHRTLVSLPMISVALVRKDSSDFSVLSKSGCDAEICDADVYFKLN